MKPAWATELDPVSRKQKQNKKLRSERVYYTTETCKERTELKFERTTAENVSRFMRLKFTPGNIVLDLQKTKNKENLRINREKEQVSYKRMAFRMTATHSSLWKARQNGRHI
jgi:hypothetical protein